MIECLTVAAILLALLLLAIRGGKHPGLEAFQGYVYAHRGLHGEQKPENSMAAFRAAVERGYGIELDVHLLRDGTLAVIHDSSLLRVTGQEGRVEALTKEDLSRYCLEGTGETIPTLSQALALVDGRVPLIVELKVDGSNYAALTAAVSELLADYNGLYCLESFDPRVVRWLKKNRPQLIRGQLTENYFRSKNPLPWYLKLCLTFQLFNFLTQPHFTAYKFSHRRNLPTALARKLWGLQGVTWTLQSRSDFDTALREGWLPIFENFIP